MQTCIDTEQLLANCSYPRTEFGSDYQAVSSVLTKSRLQCIGYSKSSVVHCGLGLVSQITDVPMAKYC